MIMHFLTILFKTKSLELIKVDLIYFSIFLVKAMTTMFKFY